MKFDAAPLVELASLQKVSVDKVVSVVESALTDAYSKSPNPVEGAVAELDVRAGTLTIVAPDGSDVTPSDFGRLAAGTMRQAVTMWLKDLDRRRKLGVWADREGTLITGKIRAHAARNARGETIIDLGDGVEAVMPAGEATAGEALKHGQEVTAFVVAVNPDERGRVKVTASRRQPKLVAELIRTKSPEVADGRVEIVGDVAREAGVRSKVAVRAAKGFNGDVEQAIIGGGAYRIREVAQKLGGEKIDVVVHPGTLEGFVANALTPAKVTQVQIVDDSSPVPHIVVAVPRDQVSLAIGQEGRNVRLAAKLTKTKIDVLVDED